jgi:cytochrome P450
MKALQGPYDMYGTVYGLSTAVVHVAHPTAALAILSPTKQKKSPWLESTGIVKAPAYNHFQNFCGQGVFTADGQDWKNKRAAVIHALFRTPEGNWETHLEQQVNLAAQKLVKTLQQTKQEPRNIVPILQTSTISLIYRYITHAELHKQRSGLVSSYLESVIRIRLIILAQSRSLWFLLPRWLYRTCSALFQQEEETMIPIREFATKACRDAQPGSPLDTLHQMPTYHTKDNSTAFSENLIFEAITLLFAGQDTSAATLSWTLHLLSLHPDIQRTVATEVQAVMKDSKDVARADFSNMPWLDAVLKESMRLYPVAPFIVRKITQPTELPALDGRPSVTLPEGALACVWIYGLHRNDAFWNNPNEFKPERWLEKGHAVVPGSYMPFAHGPRNCVGQPLAHIMLRIFLAQLLNAFDFQIPSRESTETKDMQVGFTVLPRGGVSLVAHPRGSIDS